VSFAEVVGQDRAVAALERMLARTGGAGATLILGPDGVGRFLLALCAARAILGTDEAAAARVTSLQHADLHVLDPTEGIDGVRNAREVIARRPSEGPRPVLIVRDADRLSNEALNALLKTLEEPPAGAAVFLVAESLEALPETVVSRCRIVRARRLDPDATTAVLARHGQPPDAATCAEGSPGRALYLASHGLAAASERLAALLRAPGGDPLGEVERLIRKKPKEETKDHRQRLAELLRATAARVRRTLPGGEDALRSVIEALGSLAGNANPGIVFTHLALHAWKNPPRPS